MLRLGQSLARGERLAGVERASSGGTHEPGTRLEVQAGSSQRLGCLMVPPGEEAGLRKK